MTESIRILSVSRRDAGRAAGLFRVATTDGIAYIESLSVLRRIAGLGVIALLNSGPDRNIDPTLTTEQWNRIRKAG